MKNQQNPANIKHNTVNPQKTVLPVTADPPFSGFPYHAQAQQYTNNNTSPKKAIHWQSIAAAGGKGFWFTFLKYWNHLETCIYLALETEYNKEQTLHLGVTTPFCRFFEVFASHKVQASVSDNTGLLFPFSSPSSFVAPLF